MNIFVKNILITLTLAFFSAAVASETTTTAPRVNAGPLMMIQIIQTKLILDSSMIASATIIDPTEPTDWYGLQLKLKNTAE